MTAARIAEARRQGRAALDEHGAKQVLAAYGIAVPRGVVVADATEVSRAIKALTPPLVVKLVSPDALHKSDVGGVKLNLADADAVKEAIEAIAAAAAPHGIPIEGFLIEEMAPAGKEIVIGGTIDPTFGPVVMVGLGGIFVEVLEDVSFRVCPISDIDAREMIDELRAAPILSGLRGEAPVSKEAVVDVLLKLAGEKGLFPEFADQVSEIDINPLIVWENGALAVDARLVLAPKGRDG